MNICKGEMKLKKKTITSEQGTVCYWVDGWENKQHGCILFIHGMTADHTMFDKQMEYFSENYAVICLDVPLHGESRPYKTFSYSNIISEIKTLLDQEELSHVILVGQSMGGFICQEFAIQYPKMVSAFIGVDTCPVGHVYYTKWERYILTKVGTISSWYPYSFLIKEIAKKSTKTNYAYENLYTAVSQLNKKEICTIMNLAYTDFLKRKEAVKFTFPVLLILGDSDKTGYVTKYTKNWSRNDGYPLQIIRNAAHNSNVDNYKEFNHVVDHFIHSLKCE